MNLLRYFLFVIVSTGLFWVVPVDPLFAASEYQLASPQGTAQITIHIQERITYSVKWKDRTLISSAPLSLTFQGLPPFGVNPRLRKSSRRFIDEIIVPVVPEKQSRIVHTCNELTLSFSHGCQLVFRAYDNGVAYRWVTDLKKPVIVQAEQVEFPLSDPDAKLYIPLLPGRDGVDKFHTSYEENYTVMPLRDLTPEQTGFLPLLVKFGSGPSMVITEADLDDYPGLYLCGRAGAAGLMGVFPAFPLEEQVFGAEFKQKLVTRRADYLAETSGSRAFPWRVVLLAEKDADLIQNTMVYCLAPPCKLNDTSWIRPGKCTDDWTIDTNLYGVPFRAGLNTETYKYFIDVAARFRIPYVMLDAGWSNNDDLFEINRQVDVMEVISYAREKGISLFLWTLAMTIDRQLDEVLPQFEQWGIKGIMVDFMDRDDQNMVRFYRRIAEATAKHHLMVLFHGAYKPAGLRREFPNVVTGEAVLGHEYNKWSERVTPEHIASLPFIRMTAGPLDYEGGPMLNAQKSDFRAVFNKPMSQGTRVHELALYAVFESPMQYLAGNPSDYLREPEFTQFLADIPTLWDETIALDGTVGDYLLLARRRGDNWYLAAITDWEPRTLRAPLSFLKRGDWQAEIYADGINADRYASDYRRYTLQITAADTLTLRLSPAGGCMIKLTR